MRQRNWFLSILFGAICLSIYGIAINDIALSGIFPGFGGGILMIIYAIVANEYDYSKNQKRLKKNDLYSFFKRCINCNNGEYYETKKGTCESEFFKDKKCQVCGCSILVNTSNQLSSKENES